MFRGGRLIDCWDYWVKVQMNTCEGREEAIDLVEWSRTDESERFDGRG